MRYATVADLEVARTRGANERNARVITRAGKRYTALTWELLGDNRLVFVAVAADASAFLTEEEARALGIEWDKGRRLVAPILRFIASFRPHRRQCSRRAG